MKNKPSIVTEISFAKTTDGQQIPYVSKQTGLRNSMVAIQKHVEKTWIITLILEEK